MVMYTIKSESSDGTYFLCNHWNKNKTFWISKDEIKPERLFKSKGTAIRSLKHLLEIMEDYRNDKFQIVEVHENGDIFDIPYIH